MRKLLTIGFAVLVCLAGFLWIVKARQNNRSTYTYSEFLDQVRADRVASVVIAASNSGAVASTYRLKDGKTARAMLPGDFRDALSAMQDHSVDIEIQGAFSNPLPALFQAAPVLVLLALWLYLLRNVPRLKNTLGKPV